MDATQLGRWTRFAAKGGIGKCTALQDCVAERAEDLMFLKGDEITVLMRVEDEKDKFLGYCEGVVGRFDAARVRFHSKLKTPVRTKRSSSIGVKRPTSSSFRPVSRDSISAASSTSTLIPVSKPSGSSTPSTESPLPDPSYHVPSLTSSTSSSAHGSGSPLTPSDISALTASESIPTSISVSESYASIESRHYVADNPPNKLIHSTHREHRDSGIIPHPSTPPLLAATHFSTSPTPTDDGDDDDDDDDDGIHQSMEQTSAEQSQPTQNPPSPTPTFSDASVYSSDERRISHIPTLSTHRDAELPPSTDVFETPRRPASEATGPDAADSSFAEDLSFEPRNSRISLPVSESEGTTGIGLSLLQNFISGGDDSDSDSQTDTSSHAHEATTSARGHTRARSSFDQTVEGFPVPPADIPLSPPFPASPPHQASFARPDSEATSEYDYGVDWEGASDIYDNYRYSRASMMSKMSVTSRRTPFTPPPMPGRPSFDRQGSSDAVSLRSDYSLPSPEMQRRFTPPTLSPTRPLMTTKSRPPPIEVSGSPPLSAPHAGPSPLLHTTFGSLENSPVHTPSTLDTAHPMPTPVSPNMISMNGSVERPQGAASALRQRLEVERRASAEFVLASSSSAAVLDHARGSEPTTSSESGIIVSDDEDDEGGLRARDVGPLAATLNKTKEAMLDSPLIVVNQVPPPPSYRESTSDMRSSLTVESQARFHDMPVPVLARPPSDVGLPVPLSPPASGRSPSGSTAADVSPPANFPPNPMSSPDLSIPPARPRAPRQQANAHDPATRQSLFGSSRTSVFMPHPNAPKPASVPTGPMYGRQPLQQVAAPSAAQTMHIAAAGRIGPNGVRRLGTFFGMCESELLEALEPVPIKWTLDPPNDIPANRMKRVASEANLQQQQQQKAQHRGSTRVASPASPAVEEGGTIPRANFFPKAGGARPRSQSFSGFDSPFPVPQRPPSVNTNNQEDTSRSTRSSIDSNASRTSVGQSSGPDLPAATRGGGKRQYTPSPLALQATVGSRSQAFPPTPDNTSAQPSVERLASPPGTVKARSPLTIDVPPPHESGPLSPLPLGMPRLPASPASISASVSPMQHIPSLPPASPTARMPTSASPLAPSFSSGRPASPVSPPAESVEPTTRSPVSVRRWQDSEKQPRTSAETESSHYSDTRSMMSSPPLMGSPLRRSTSLRSKLSFSTLRSPRSATRDDAGIISPTIESHTVQVEDLDFELVTPAQPPSQTTAHSMENGSPILPPPSLADSVHLRASAASPTGSSFSSVPRSPTSPFSPTPPQASVSAPGPSTESMEAHRQRELKWVALMNSTKAAEARKNKKVRKLLQEGVPASVRYQVWAHLTDSRSKRLKGLYPRLCARGRVAVSDEIERDVRAAFERDSRLDSKSLVSLLQAYVTMVPDIQYEPGLTYVAGQLLLQSPEEDAFWIFISLMDTHLRPYFAANGVQLEVDAALFAKAVEANDPTVAKRLFVDYSIPPIDVVRPWFSSLFVEALPVEYFQRVWDIFLSEGVVFLFRVGVAVLICCRRTLLDTKGDAAVLNLLRNPPTMLISSTPDRLIDLANSIKLKDDDIRKQRVKMEAQVKRQAQGKLFGAGGARANASSPSISLPSRS